MRRAGSGPPERSRDLRWEYVVAGVLLVLWPGILAGASLAYLYWTRRRSPRVWRWFAALVLAVFGLPGGAVVIWQAFGDDSAWYVVVLQQVLVGPLVLIVAYTARSLIVNNPSTERISDPNRAQGASQEAEPEGAAVVHRDRKAMVNGVVPAMSTSGQNSVSLGRTGGRIFEVELPAGLARHVSILGDTGTGKTTTIIRIIYDAMRAGYAVVCVDAKGTGTLREATEALAAMFEAPYGVVDPEDPETMGYNPARGTPAQVGNKLLGAFRFGPNAEVFKQISGEMIPTVVEALQEVGEPVNLKTLRRYLGKDAVSGLVRRGGDAAEELAELMDSGKLYETTIPGIRGRFGNLRKGAYGPVFDVAGEDDGLDVYKALAEGVTYVSLSAMASSEDTELLARVLIQDTKQAASRRLRELRSASVASRPALLVLDEFAALNEAEQIIDLLLQAREAGISVVLSTQLLPLSAPLRKTMLSSGLLISHAVGDQDAQQVAAAFGQRRRLDVRHSYESEEGEAGEDGRVSFSSRDDYAIKPDAIGKLRLGQAAVKLRYGDVRKIATVQVAPVDLKGSLRERSGA